MTASPLAAYKRIAVKVGSALLVDTLTGALRVDWLESLSADVAALHADGRQIIIVSSGAVSLGRRVLKLASKTLTLEQSQAAASVGQIALSQAWRDALGRHGVTTGQILLTPNITEERRYYLNARATIRSLLAFGAVPIINENDSVATAEIRYGDNDRLSARVAVMLEADALVILSDVDGLYSAPPDQNPEAKHIPVIEAVTPQIEAMAGGASNHLARGGMTTKVEAAKIATQSGTAMLIARATDAHPLAALAMGARFSLFKPTQSPAAARKRWILGTLGIGGHVYIDAGAAKALETGKSLLPIGVTRVTGGFSRGDAISIVGPDGIELARGLAGMSAEQANLAKGKKSGAVAEMFGFDTRSELVHADNIALLSAKTGGAP